MLTVSQYALRRYPFQVRIAHPCDYQEVVGLINIVAAERRYLQTDHFVPNPLWEQLLCEGVNIRAGLLLLVAQMEQQIIGFGRVNPDAQFNEARSVGNIGIVLLPSYRSMGIGSKLLEHLVMWASCLQFQKLNAAILATNVHSQNLFRKFGFQIASRRKAKLPFQERQFADELLYELDINSREVPCCTQHQLHFWIANSSARKL